MNIRHLFQRKDEFPIPVSVENRRRLAACRAAIARAEPLEALRELACFSLETLDTECTQVEARLNHLNSQEVRGVLSSDEARREFNRINESILSLVQRLERAFGQDEKNYQTLRNNLQLRYAGRLRQKLGDRQSINIRRFYSTVGTTPVGAAAYKDVVVPDTEVRQTMLETFDAADGRLLVVGQPGVGKTTLLLQLALVLLEKRPDHIAAVLNLATWRSEFGTFDAWLERILPLELGVSRTLAIQIQHNSSFILLLDGLDEVPAEDRDSCLKAIGHYGAEAGNSFVISSRIDEYGDASKDAPVFLQIEMRPLTAEQIETELASAGLDRPEAARLRVALQHDSLLREAVATPFYLNTAQILFAEGLNWNELGFTATHLEGRKRELVEAFVENGLQGYSRGRYPSQKTERWLTFLARKMNEENIAMFELVNLQPWWMQRGKIRLAILDVILHAAIYGFLGLSTSLVISVVKGHFDKYIELLLILFWVLVGISGALGRWFKNGGKIITYEVRIWSWAHFQQNWRMGFLAYAVALLSMFNNFYNNNVTARKFIIGLFVSISMILLGFWWSGTKISNLLQINKPYQRFNASLSHGVFPIIPHACLRLAIFIEGSLPLYLVDFLDEMAARHLLESDGGSWRFRHKILQDYFLESGTGNGTSRKPDILTK